MISPYLRAAVAALLVTVVVALAACGGGGGSADTLRLGVFPNVTHGPGLIEIQNGDLAKRLGAIGKKLEVKSFNDGTEASAALLAGQVDATYIGPSPALTAHAADTAIRILAGVNDGGARLVVRDDAKISSLRDLAGKRVGVPAVAATQDVVLRLMLAEQGLKASDQGGDVEIQGIKNPEAVAAFQNGSIDAGFYPDPTPIKLLGVDGTTLLADTPQTWRGGRYPTTVIIAKESLDPAARDALLAANQAGIDEITADPDAAAEQINQQITALASDSPSTDQIRESLRSNTPTAALDPGTFADIIGLEKDAGYLENAFDPAEILPKG